MKAKVKLQVWRLKYGVYNLLYQIPYVPLRRWAAQKRALATIGILVYRYVVFWNRFFAELVDEVIATSSG